MEKITSAAEAVAQIADGACIVICGTGPVLEPDLILAALEERYIREKHPTSLTLVSPMCAGERPEVGGLNTFIHKGMLKRLIASSLNTRRHPALVEMLRRGEVEGYMIGMGTIMQMLNAAGGRKPGVHTTVGIGTFLDPRLEGGRMNDQSPLSMASVQQLDDREYLYYRALPVDVAIIRATTADEDGYLCMDEETNYLGVLDMALAAKASGGRVIAQVKRLTKRGALDPRLVRIPGPLVDAVVVHPEQRQLMSTNRCVGADWNPALVGAIQDPMRDLPRLRIDARRLILRRAAFELRRNDVVNVGAGLPTDLPSLLHEVGILDRITMTNEHGIFGGLLATAVYGSFVPALNPRAIMDSQFQFSYYDGGGLDVAFLGAGEIGANGDVNVSKFGALWNGTGGFCDITDRTRRIVFCGSFTSGGLETAAEGRTLKILKEGRFCKFVPSVEQVTFSGRRAAAQEQDVQYLTERAVFRLDEDGIRLTEIAPGVDIEQDIRQHLSFDLRIDPGLKLMDDSIFSENASEFSSRLEM